MEWHTYYYLQYVQHVYVFAWRGNKSRPSFVYYIEGSIIFDLWSDCYANFKDNETTVLLAKNLTESMFEGLFLNFGRLIISAKFI